MATQLDLVNRALLSIGARAQVSSITPSDGSTEADAASVLYAPTFESLGRAAPWGCLRAQASLTLLAAATGTPENPTGTTLGQPPTPWLYQYSYPSECLQVRYLLPALSATGEGAPPETSYNNAASPRLPWGSGQIPFAIAYSTDSGGNPISTILTNQSQAQAVYTVNQPNPLVWDSKLQAAMVASLAAYLVPALSLNLPLMQASIATAERLIVEARVADGNESVTVMDHLPDWIRARGGESGWGLGNGGIPGPFYANMTWPAF